MNIFTKKESISLENFIGSVVSTAFEYPTQKNILLVDTEKDLDNVDIETIIKNVPNFMIAVNCILLVLSAQDGKIKRFKGDSLEEISSTIFCGSIATVQKYLFEVRDYDKKQISDEAGFIFENLSNYLDVVDKARENAKDIDDIFFEMCQQFSENIVHDISTQDNRDKQFVIFDFSKQLYYNIKSGFGSLTIG